MLGRVALPMSAAGGTHRGGFQTAQLTKEGCKPAYARRGYVVAGAGRPTSNESGLENHFDLVQRLQIAAS